MKTRKRKHKQPPAADKEAGIALDAFLTKPKKTPRTKKKPAFELALASAKLRSKSGDWEKATGRIFVGLYAMCHEIVYGILPLELRPDTEMMKAGRVAKRCLATHFENDPDEFVDFIKWTWERVKSTEAWAMQQGRQINRLSVWSQFSGHKVTDYRLEQRRRKGRKRGK